MSFSTPFSVHDSHGPLDVGTCKSYEITFARRAMNLMRRTLGAERLTELLQEDITRADEYWQSMSEQSNGQWQPARIQLSMRGLGCDDFLDWFLPKGRDDDPDMEKLSAHPEHWAVNATQDGIFVLETLGDKVSRFWLKFYYDKAADFVADLPDHPRKMIGRGCTEAGVPMVEVCHQFRDHEDKEGFDVDLAVYFPSTCEEDLRETHRRHLMVEFRNWFEQAYRSSRLSS